MEMFAKVTSAIAGEVLRSEEDREEYSRDTSLFKITPSLVAIPKTVDDIKNLVALINKEQQQGVSLTVRSGGTCMSGGPLSESIIVDVSKHINSIQEVSGNTLTVQPGAYYRDFEKKAREANLLLPSYPASREICTVGGMVNNNSGGEKTLAYGKTNRFIKELQVVLSDGQEYTLSALSKNQLEEKMKLDTFEGDIYRRMFKLLDENQDIIRKAKPNVSKNSTGYALWDVWDGQTFDLTQLFCGSQGTLGITTNITFRLIKPKPSSTMLVIFLKSFDNLSYLVNDVLKYQPESFESYDDQTLNVALKFFPQLIKQMGIKKALSLSWQILPEMRLLLTGGIPKLVLLAEFTGHSEEEVRQRAEAANAAIAKYGLKTRVTKSQQEADKYWIIRRESFNLLRNKVKDKHTAPFIDDLIVRPEQLPEFLPRLNEILSHYDITYTIAGHIGDANFHIIPLMDLASKSQRHIIPKLAEEVYDLVFEFKGSMSGEHNDGLVRGHFLKKMYGEEIYNLFSETKHIFDPNNIFNPGKKVGVDWQYALDHMITE